MRMKIKHYNPQDAIQNAEIAQAETELASLDTRVDTLEATILNYTSGNQVGWMDIIGDTNSGVTGVTSPTLASMTGGNIKAPYYSRNNQLDLDYHIPHEYLPGSDMYFHLHFGHSGTQISGTQVIQCSMAWARLGQAWSSEKVFNLVIPCTNLTVTPRHTHLIAEIKISGLVDTAVQFASSVFQFDGKLKVNMTVISDPAISGGVLNTLYWLGADVHCQSTGHGTVDRLPT